MSRYLTLSSPSGISGADLKRRIGSIMAGRPLRSLGPAKRALLGACGIAVLAAPLALGLAASPLSVLAQAPASVQGAGGAALGAPAQPKAVALPVAPTVKAGTGQGSGPSVNTPSAVKSAEGDEQSSAPKAQTIEAAIQAGDWRQAVTLGATTADIVPAAQARGELRGYDPVNSSLFIGPAGRFTIVTGSFRPVDQSPPSVSPTGQDPSYGSIVRRINLSAANGFMAVPKSQPTSSAPPAAGNGAPP